MVLKMARMTGSGVMRWLFLGMGYVLAVGVLGGVFNSVRDAIGPDNMVTE